MQTYRRGKYEVVVADDGAIKVKPGDWLSKFSAAIYDDFIHVHEFGRLNRNGQMELVANVNRIVAHETLYHIATYQRYKKHTGHPFANRTPPPSPKLPYMKEKQLIEESLARDHGLYGENLHYLHIAVELSEAAHTTATILEIAGLLEEGAAAGEAIAVVSAFLVPLGIMISAWNAGETDMKLYGMQAAAYATTAWAFADLIPGPSQEILKRNVRFYGPDEEGKLRGAWQRATTSTVRSLEDFVLRKRIEKQSYQILLRAWGETERQTLCEKVMEAFTEDLNNVESDSLKSIMEVKYPQ